MKGFLLSMDAIVAASLLLLLALFVTGFSSGISHEEIQVKQAYYTARDAATLFLTATASDVQNLQVVKDYIDSGTITKTDVNRTLIELIGYWWAAGNMTEAANVTKAVMDAMLNTTPYGYELLFDNNSIYKRNVPLSGFITKTTAVISGVSLGKQPEGFAASAFATGVVKNTTRILPVEPAGSAWKSGETSTITKRFYLNATKIVRIKNATLYVSTHFGGGDLSSLNVLINRNPVTLTLVNQSFKRIGDTETSLVLETADVRSLLNLGQWNKIDVGFQGGAAAWHSHVHPGFRLELEIQENETSLATTAVKNETLYFDNVESGGTAGSATSGAWAILPFSIPKDAAVQDVRLFVEGRNVNNISPLNMPGNVPEKYNIQMYLNNVTIGLTNPATLNENEEVNVSLVYNLTGNITNGTTNVVSVYLNSYGNDFWGRGNTTLYSDEENDPANSSRVQVVYGKSPQEQKFGHIAVGALEHLGGGNSNPKLYNKVFGAPLHSAFLHLTQLDSGNVTVNVSSGGPVQKAFQTPRPFATPTRIFIEPQLLSTSQTNTLNISDTCTTLCDVLPESGLEYIFWVPSLVGYGSIYPNSSAAAEDALNRLSSVMGGFAEVTQVVNDTQSVPGVPSLWGPARMEVRIWV